MGNLDLIANEKFQKTYSMKSIVFTFLFFPFSFLALGQTGAKNDTTISFQVSGNCEMCKETIESSLDVKGVKKAIWDQKLHLLTVTFNPGKISEDGLHDLVAASGYDTEKKNGNDKAYADLPECCHYERRK